MKQDHDPLLEISGICGMLSPSIAFAGIMLGVLFFPHFSWTQSALSDLGVAKGISSQLYNYGLMLSALPAIIFTYGLFVFLKKGILGKIGIAVFFLAAMALACIGAFPSNMQPAHYQASAAFFVLFPISMFFMSAEFFISTKPRLALLTLLLSFAAVLVWVVQWMVGFGSGVAIPETVAALCVSAWTFYFGYKFFTASKIWAMPQPFPLGTA